MNSLMYSQLIKTNGNVKIGLICRPMQIEMCAKHSMPRVGAILSIDFRHKFQTGTKRGLFEKGFMNTVLNHLENELVHLAKTGLFIFKAVKTVIRIQCANSSESN